MKKSFYIPMILGIAVTSQAGWTLIDNFDGYDNSLVTTIGANGSGDATAGVWDGVFDGTGNAMIYDNAGDAADNELEVWGIPAQGSTGWRGASTDLANNFGTDFTFADNSTNTIFFQFMVGNSGNFDCMFGLTDSQGVLDNTDSWTDFAVMPFLSGGTAGVADFKATSASGDVIGIENVAADTWYNVWLIVDTANNQFDVYTSTGTDPGTLVINDAVFRNSKGTASLTAFGIAEREAGQVRIDNIYFAPGANTINPLAAVLLDDFSGDLNAYIGTRILDSDGGTHNTASWQIASGALELNTSTKVSDAEQYAFIRAGLSLGVHEEIRAEFNVSGSQDLGLYVGGTTPATDVRQDYIAVYARGDGNIYSRGFDGTTVYGLEGAGVVTYDKLFIKRSATNTYEAGYYNGDTRTVIVTRTPSTPNDGDVVGFYADVRASGTLGNADNLALIPSDDADGDGLSDAWEQQIIDANPGDAIETIQDVNPEDDFDGDGFSNLQEYELGLDPTVHDDSSTDADGDYLPDLWEINNLSNLTYNSYDDPDNDGYNNQAERIGNTDPLITSEHPSWVSPSVAFMRDSVVTNNACLMGGGIYGRSINGVSFQDQILYTFNGYQYTAYYDTVGSVQKVCLARRTVNETAVGEWDIVQTDSEFLNGDESTWDAHNVVAFGICPQDGTLHVAWDHHDATLRYRRSVVGLCTTNKDAWGQPGMLNTEQNWLTAPGVDSVQLGDVTYPQFITTPSGGLVMDRRYVTSGNGDQYLNVYNPVATNWLPQVEFIDRAGTYTGPSAQNGVVTCYERCAYLNGFDFDTSGTIHVTWTWRESASQYGNRDICYAYSPDLGTNWYNNAGTKIADTSLGEKITQGSAGVTVVPIDMQQLLINQQAQCVDNDGRVHALMLHRRQDPGYEYPNYTTAKFGTLATAYYHYFRDPVSGEWTQRRIAPDAYPVGSRPCIGYDANGNVYAAFVSYSTGTDTVPGYTYGKLVVASASKASDYTDWAILQIVDGPFDGEPLLDQARLLSDNILAVYIQEHDTYTTGNGIPTPLHVFEFAVDIPEPESPSRIAISFLGDDVLISAFGQTGSNYQLQATADLTLTNGWANVGSPVGGMDSLLALPSVDALQNEKGFYKVFSNPAP